jgi:hypothetical protein
MGKGLFGAYLHNTIESPLAGNQALQDKAEKSWRAGPQAPESHAARHQIAQGASKRLLPRPGHSFSTFGQAPAS